MSIKIDEGLKRLIPPLSGDELQQLEENLVADGCRDPLVLWGDTLVDGHNRYEICTRLGIPFETVQMEFESEGHARIWMRNNQRGRRNLTKAWEIELALGNKEDLAAIGATKKVEAGQETGRGNKKVLSQNDKTFIPPAHNTQAQIAKSAGTSTGMVGMAEQVMKKAPELWERAKSGEVAITAAYKTVKKQEEIQQRSVAIKEELVAATQANPATITLGDAVEWLRDQEDYDLLLTDPPYSTDVEDVEGFARSWLPLALSKVKPTGRAFVFIGAYPRELKAYLDVAMPEQVLVWTYRNTLGPSPKLNYKANWQAILYYRMPEAPDLDCPVMLEQFAVQDISAPDGRLGDRYHAWQKPISLAERLVRHSTRLGAVVADPFACTGTFLLAASKLGRIGIGCDISEEHIAIALERGCRRG
jgi:hypothetical protein